MSLPSSWIDALFAKLTLRYGNAFMDQWRNADPALLKADWADVLGGFDAHPDAIKYALANLPEKPLNAIQFRNIARLSPLPKVTMLDAPPVDPEKRRVALALAKSAVRRVV